YNLGNIKKLTSEVETLQEEKDVVDGKLACLLKSSKDLENIIESQRSSNTHMDKENPWGKDGPGKDVELYLYRSMLLHPDQTSCLLSMHVLGIKCHLHAVKRIFRYLMGHPKLGLWYPKASSFDLVAYSDSDYGGASQDRKSTTGGSQFLGRRLISWQYKKQTIVATSTTEAEYVAAASCCGQVLLQFCDYNNMVVILEKSEHNADFHPIVDFIEASPLRVKAQEHQLSPITQPIKRLNHISSSSIPTVIPIPTVLPIPIVTQSEPTPLRHYTRRVRIAQSSTLPPIADEPASPVRDVMMLFPLLVRLLPLPLLLPLIQEEREKKLWWSLTLQRNREKGKKQKTSKEVPDKEKSPKEIPKEKVKEMMQLVPIEEVYVQALQVKHPIIDWKVHIEGQGSYWKIIRLGGSLVCYQFFVDLLKHLDREDLNQLWVLVKEYLSIRPASSDKEIELWVELKRLYEPDPKD
nr:uncharacterized mitochondrial protein AtMg00810-like [Tanacetum cinerariifolium]